MEYDYVDFIRICVKSQMHGDVIRTPPAKLHNMIVPWPCSIWRIDVIGAVDPPASNGYRFILVSIKYFIIEATSTV